MAKNKSKVEVKEEQTLQPEEIEEVPQEQEVVEEQPKEEKKVEKKPDNKKQDNKKKDNKKKERKPRGKRVKETISELKKVTWPTFGSVVKKTGIVLAVVVIFAVVLFGIDRLLAWLFDLLTNQVA